VPIVGAGRRGRRWRHASGCPHRAPAGRVERPERIHRAGGRTRAPGTATSAAGQDSSRGKTNPATLPPHREHSRTFPTNCANFNAPRIDALLKRTDPALLGLCLDTGHLTFAGGDPLAALAAYGDRIWHVHFKDCDPALAAQSRIEGWDYHTSVRRGIFCELGRGSVPFAAVLAALRARQYAGWIVVEQDVLPGLGTPAASAARNREYLRGLTPPPVTPVVSAFRRTDPRLDAGPAKAGHYRIQRLRQYADSATLTQMSPIPTASTARCRSSLAVGRIPDKRSLPRERIHDVKRLPTPSLARAPAAARDFRAVGSTSSMPPRSSPGRSTPGSTSARRPRRPARFHSRGRPIPSPPR
jgi:hypothetical protein